MLVELGILISKWWWKRVPAISWFGLWEWKRFPNQLRERERESWMTKSNNWVRVVMESSIWIWLGHSENDTQTMNKIEIICTKKEKHVLFHLAIVEYERHLKLMSATPVTSWLENLIFDYIELLALFLMSLYITFHLQWRNYGCTRNDHNSGCVHDAIQCNIHRHSF